MCSRMRAAIATAPADPGGATSASFRGLSGILFAVDIFDGIKGDENADTYSAEPKGRCFEVHIFRTAADR